jgi:hypothetical protein
MLSPVLLEMLVAAHDAGGLKFFGDRGHLATTGARRNWTAKVPSQHDCAVAGIHYPGTIFVPMLQQRCQPNPHGAR